MCGPRNFFARCCEEQPYCNEGSGFCGMTAAHRDAQLGDTYDYHTRGRLCDRVTQWSNRGWSTPAARGSHTLAPTLHLHAHKAASPNAEKLPGNLSGWLAQQGKEASLDFGGFNTVVRTATNFANLLQKGFTATLWLYPEGVGPGPWQQAVILAIGKELQLTYGCFGTLAVKNIHVIGQLGLGVAAGLGRIHLVRGFIDSG